MLVIALKTLLQEAAASVDEKHLSGNIRDPDALFDPSSIDALEARHPGPFAFLAFDPTVDKAIVDYLTQETIASDSGDHTLVLFIGNETNGVVSKTRQSLGDWLSVESVDQPANRLVQMLFEPRPTPPLPGIAFYPSLQGDREAVYVGLAGLADATAVRGQLRSLFSLVNEAWVESSSKREVFISRFAAKLLRSGIDFERAGRLSVREWFVRSYTFLARHQADLISAVSLGTAMMPLG